MDREPNRLVSSDSADHHPPLNFSKEKKIHHSVDHDDVVDPTLIHVDITICPPDHESELSDTRLRIHVDIANPDPPSRVIRVDTCRSKRREW